MTNQAIAIYEQMGQMQTASAFFFESGLFTDIKSKAQAMVKIMAGAEIGIAPFASMSGIHIVNGKPTLGANIIATLVKDSGRYDYRIVTPLEKQNGEMVIEWYENGQAVGRSSFTLAEAQAAGLTGKQTWKAYPSDMLFARALTRGARRYAPGIFGGAPVYTPDEMGVEVDEDGYVVQQRTTPTNGNGNGHNAPATIMAAPVVIEADTDSGLPDDEMVVSEAPAAKFVSTAASLLGVETDAVKERLRALGYTSIPGKSAERVTLYRRLKSEPQPALVVVQEAEPTPNGAYAE